MREDQLPKAGCPEEMTDYAFELIRLHHSFRIDRIVSAASALEAHLLGASAQQFVGDLYTLISADNVISGLYEKALAASGGAFSFGDPAQDRFLLHDLVGKGVIERSEQLGETRRCHVGLQWKTASGSKTLKVDVTYHIVEVG